ncbi:MAG: YdeI/OmpD-associated family protein [bacterium]
MFYRKHTGRPRIPYDDAVEEALCYGWIDSTVKTIDTERFAQRFSPRKPRSNLSEMNKERIRRLIARKKMTAAGLAAVRHVFDPAVPEPRGRGVSRIRVAPDITKALRTDAGTWRNFRKFPVSYKRVRIGWIEMARKRPAEFTKRLRYFVRMTARNRRFGMVQ